MEIDYSQEKNHKCPYCALSCPELERFKQHLINCRKCNDMDVYVCSYYFGHVFATQIELDNHYKQCIFTNGPVLYGEKKRIRLGKAAKEQIMNEYYPLRPTRSAVEPPPANRNPPVSRALQVVENTTLSVGSNNNLSTTTASRSYNREPEIVNNHIENSDVFHYYIFEDLPTMRTFNLMYSFGLELSVNTLLVNNHKDVKEFGNFFDPETFDEEKFKKYSSLYTLFIPENEYQSFTYFRKSLGKKIGINDSKASSHNEILIVATSDSDVIGKFVWTEIAFLIVPASLLLDIPVTPAQESFYMKSRARVEKQTIQDPRSEIEKKKSLKDRLLEDVKEIKEAKINSLFACLNEIMSATVSIEELQDLSQTLDFIYEDLEKKKKESRYQRSKEMEAIRKEIQENRKYNNDLRMILNQKEKKIQQAEEAAEKNKIMAKSKFDKALKNKLDECDEMFLVKKREIETDMNVNSTNQSTLKDSISNLRENATEQNLRLTQTRAEVDDYNKKIRKLEDELFNLSIKEKEVLKDTLKDPGFGVGTGAPKLSDFNCPSCKSRYKDVVFLPCRHMLKCRVCCINTREGASKCDECGLIIQKAMEVKKVEYKPPFDELLGRK